MSKKFALPEIEEGPARFLKVYDAAVSAQLDMQKTNRLIEAAIVKEHGLTHAQARLWWASKLIKARPG